MKYFTSDTHFRHGNILAFEPWRQSWARNISAMDEKLIEAWNAKVLPHDTIYHLGDFCFGNENQIHDIAKRLNGEIYLILGNHDRTAASNARCGLRAVKSIQVTSDTGLRFICKHDPRKFTVQEAEENDFLLHGHLHGQLHHDGIDPRITAKLLDVGVDAVRSIYPLTIEEVSELCMRKSPIS